MALLAVVILVFVAIAGVAILLYAAILDIAGLVRGDLGAQSQMQQRRYDDVVGLCERIEAILEARQIGVLKFHVAKQDADRQAIQYAGMSYEQASREGERLIAESAKTGYWFLLPEKLTALRDTMARGEKKAGGNQV